MKIRSLEPQGSAMIFGHKMSRKTSQLVKNMTSWNLRNKHFWHHVWPKFRLEVTQGFALGDGCWQLAAHKSARFSGMVIISVGGGGVLPRRSDTACCWEEPLLLEMLRPLSGLHPWLFEAGSTPNPADFHYHHTHLPCASNLEDRNLLK